MQGTIGGSLRPCTSLLHSSLSLSTQTSRLSLYRSLVGSIPPSRNSKVSVTFALKSSRSIVYNEEKMLGSNVVHRLCGHQGGGGELGLGLRRNLTKVAARRSLLSELKTLKEEADGGPVEFELPLQVVLYPDPRLRAKNKYINVFDEKLQQLVKEMFELMYKTDGVGLAAPQVGVNVRLMVYNPVGERGQGEEYVLVNPRIVKYGKTRDVFGEGCLSFPSTEGDPKKAPTIEAEVERPKSVRVEAQDIKGKKFSINLKEWQARIFQHEFDHLEGTLYFDRMTPEVLDTIRPELENLEKLYERHTGLPAPERISSRQ